MNHLIKRIFVALIVALLVIAATLLIIRFLPQKAVVAPGPAVPAAGLGLAPSSAVSAGEAAPPAGSPPSAPPPAGSPAPEASQEQKLLNSLTIAARDFAERYGSYSSEGNFENLRILLPSMTESFRAKTEALLEKNRVAASGAAIGVTTKALKVTAAGKISASEPAAVVVLTQRISSGAAGTTVSYEELNLTMLYQEGLWKVDSAEWRKG